MDTMQTPNNQSKFPWLNEKQIAKIEEYTKDLTWAEKIQEQQKYYEALMKVKQQQSTNENRMATENQMYAQSLTEKDPKQKNYLQSNVRLEQLADLTKSNWGLDANSDTKDTVNALMDYAESLWVDLDSLNNYLEKWDETFLYEVWLKEDKKSVVNAGVKWAIMNWTDDPRIIEQWDEVLEDWRIRHHIKRRKGDERNDYFFPRMQYDSYDEDASTWKKVWTWFKNAWKWVVNIASDVWNMVLNPLDTLWTIGNTVWGALLNATWLDEKVENMEDWTVKNILSNASNTASAVGDMLEERYWSDEAITKTLYEDPVGVASDIASLVSWGAWLTKNIAKGWAKLAWTTSKVGGVLNKVADIAEDVSRVSNKIDPYSQATWLLGKAWWKIADVAWNSKVVQSIKQGVTNFLSQTDWYQKFKKKAEEYISKSIKPTVKGKQNMKDYQKFMDNTLDTIDYMQKNKDKLKFTNADGEAVTNRLPETMAETREAIGNLKKSVYDEYNNIAKQAWEAWAVVDTKPIVSKLKEISKDKVQNITNPWIKNTVNSYIKAFDKFSKNGLSIDDAQKITQWLNQELSAFFKNPNMNDVSSSAIKAQINNMIKDSINNSINNVLDNWISKGWNNAWAYQRLKQTYWKMLTVEDELSKRALVEARKNAKWLDESIMNAFAGGEITDALLTLDPVKLAKWWIMKGITEYYKHLNSPDTQIKKLFSLVDDYNKKNIKPKADTSKVAETVNE